MKTLPQNGLTGRTFVLSLIVMAVSTLSVYGSVIAVSIEETLKGSDHLDAYRPEFKASVDELFSDVREIHSKLEEIQNEIAVLEAKAEDEGLSEEDKGVLNRFRKLQSEQNKVFLELNREKEAIYQERRNALWDLHTDDIAQTMRKHCKEDSVSLVLPIDGNVIIYINPELDATAVLIEKLNADMK